MVTSSIAESAGASVPALPPEAARQRRWPGARGRLIAATAGSALIYGLYLLLVAPLPAHYDRPGLYLFAVLGAGWSAFLLFAGAVLLLSACAAIVWQTVAAPDTAGGAGPAARAVRRWALVPPPLFASFLTLCQPLGSRDLFHYIMEGRILGVHGANPYLFPPSAYPNDPFFPYANWVDYTSPYGPLWVGLSAGLALLGGGSLFWTVLAFKLAALAGWAACGAIIWSTLARLGRSPLAGTTLWLWNPLVLFEFPGAGHNDVLMLAGGLLGLRLLLAERPRAAMVAFIVAALVKYVALVLMPLALWAQLRPLPGWRARAREAFHLLLLPGALFVGALALFWVGAATLGPLREANHYYASPAHVVRLTLESFLPSDRAGRIVRGGIILILGAGYLRLLWGAARDRAALLAAAAGTMLLLIALWPAFVPWYVAWVVAFAALVPARRVGGRVLLLSAGALLSYLPQLWLPARWPVPVGWRSVLTVLLVFFPLLLVSLPRAELRARLVGLWRNVPGTMRRSAG